MRGRARVELAMSSDVHISSGDCLLTTELCSSGPQTSSATFQMDLCMYKSNSIRQMIFPRAARSLSKCRLPKHAPCRGWIIEGIQHGIQGNLSILAVDDPMGKDLKGLQPRDERHELLVVVHRHGRQVEE